MKVAEQTSILAAADGEPIRVHKWQGDGQVRGVVQIAHGMGEHSLRYRPIAEALASAGFVVYANDHRGHGELAAKAEKLGDFGAGGFPDLVADMVKVTEAARAEHSGKPLALLGHSMGSFATQLYLLDHSHLLDGAALSGSAALDHLGAAAMAGKWRLEDLNASFQPERTPFDWLSGDNAQVDLYLADPLCGFTINDASFGSLFSAAPRLADIGEIKKIRSDLPLFIFAGDMDPVNADLKWLRPLIDRYREAGLSRVSWHIYGNARHEVLNESNRDEVFANVIAWLNIVVAR
jgi:alpha-beta hydrolase superfamily lysophospholipase